jgi:hypothetical protein
VLTDLRDLVAELEHRGQAMATMAAYIDTHWKEKHEPFANDDVLSPSRGRATIPTSPSGVMQLGIPKSAIEGFMSGRP